MGVRINDTIWGGSLGPDHYFFGLLILSAGAVTFASSGEIHENRTQTEQYSERLP